MIILDLNTSAQLPNFTNIPGLVSYTNTITNGLMPYLFIIGLWFIIFAALSAYRKQESILTSTFVTFIVSTLFWAAGYISLDAFMLITISLITAALLLFKSDTNL